MFVVDKQYFGRHMLERVVHRVIFRRKPELLLKSLFQNRQTLQANAVSSTKTLVDIDKCRWRADEDEFVGGNPVLLEWPRCRKP